MKHILFAALLALSSSPLLGDIIAGASGSPAEFPNGVTGGLTVDTLTATGAVDLTGATSEISVPTSGECPGGGNVCSGAFAPVESNFTNLEGTNPSVTSSFIRVGNVITMGFRLDNFNPDGGGLPSFEFTVPFGPIVGIGNGGTCSGTQDISNMGVRIATATTLEVIEFFSTTNVPNGTYYCTVTYSL